MFFCKHEWEKISEVTLPSAYEQAPNIVESLRSVGPWLFQKTHTLTLACKKCGTVTTVRSENP